MALVIEDGTGLENANSYVTLSYADAYANERNYVDWLGLSGPDKEAHLILATQYLDRSYRSLWKGQKATAEQSLTWPRVWVTDEDGYAVGSNLVPKVVKEATVELAVKSMAGELLPDQARGGMVKKSKVDVIEQEFFEGAPSGTSRPAIQGLLSGLVTGDPTSSSRMVSVGRA